MIDFKDAADKCTSTTHGAISGCFEQLGIAEKVNICVSDSAFDLSCCIRRFDNITHIQCFSHKIHNTIVNSTNNSLYEIFLKKVC